MDTSLDGANNESLYTYFVLMYQSTAPGYVKQTIDLPFRRGIITIEIIKQIKPFTEKRFKRYMRKYYPNRESMYDYCYDVSRMRLMKANTLAPTNNVSPVAEIYRLINIKLRNILNHYCVNCEVVHPIDSKRSFKTYDGVNYLSTLTEVNAITRQVLDENSVML